MKLFEKENSNNYAHDLRDLGLMTGGPPVEHLGPSDHRKWPFNDPIFFCQM